LSETAKPIAGAVIVGVSLIFFPQVSAMGTTPSAMPSRVRWARACCLAGRRQDALTTSVTLGCAAAAEVTPAMFIGAMLGGGFAGVTNHLFPGTVAEPGAFALVGMGAFLAAATHAPLTAIFMVWELTQNIGSVVPAMLASVTGTLVARGLLADSIDTYELRRKGFDVHRPRRILGILRGLVTRILAPRATGLAIWCRQLTNTGTHPPVVDERRAAGVIQLEDLREIPGYHEAASYHRREIAPRRRDGSDGYAPMMTLMTTRSTRFRSTRPSTPARRNATTPRRSVLLRKAPAGGRTTAA
jgi:CIC family chloride channel protein